MTRDEYNKMDVVKAITTWNEENKLNTDDDLAPWNYFSKE